MKGYEEIAKNVFDRRDEYVIKQKKKKKILLSTATAIFCCVIVVAGFGLYKNANSRNDFFVVDSSQNELENPKNDSLVSNDSASTNENSSNTQENTSQDVHSSQPSNNNEDNSQGEVVSDTPNPNPDDTSSSTDEPGNTPEENEFLMDSIDKINFYSAKKIINDHNLLPFSTANKNSSLSNMILLNNGYYEYPLDRDKVYTISMVTYFTITLNDEKGFLAQKLGGTGNVEVVVTENDINSSSQMITFKREDNYYTCFMNHASYDNESDRVSREFSTHIYIDGFNTVKNFEQENYEFIVRYEGSKVVGFECVPFKCVPQKYNIDDITFVEDYCAVIFTNQKFTIDQLEMYFKNNTEELCNEKINSFYIGFGNNGLLSGL